MGQDALSRIRNDPIGGMTVADLDGRIQKKLDDQQPSQMPGLIDLIAAATPPGTVRLTLAAAADGGWAIIPATLSKIANPNLDKILAAAGYPWGEEPDQFTVAPILDDVDGATWQVKTG